MKKTLREDFSSNGKVAKENAEHGSLLFPCACYDSWIRESFPSINLHWHPEIEINLVLSGTAEVSVNFESHIITEGDIIIMNKDDVHGFFRYESSDFNCKSIVFHMDFVLGKSADDVYMEIFSPLINKEKKFTNFLNHNSTVYIEIKKLLEEIFFIYENKQPYYKLLLKSEILKLLYTLYYFEMVKNSKALTKENMSLKAAIDYIEQNYKRHISAEEIAAVAGYSKYHFLRIFKRATGIEFSRYVNRVRLEHAALLLKKSNLSVTDIAMTTGFSDSAYFARKFKEEFHITPLTFRKKINTIEL